MFLNRTNNWLESLNQKIKDVCSRNKSLEQLFEDFFAVLQSLGSTRDHIGNVKQQLQLSNKVKGVQKKDSGDEFYVDSSSDCLTVSDIDCNCSFRTAMTLPYRHIFAVHAIMSHDAFDLSLSATRWTVTYYKSKHYVLRKQCMTSESSRTGAVAPGFSPKAKSTKKFPDMSSFGMYNL